MRAVRFTALLGLTLTACSAILGDFTANDSLATTEDATADVIGPATEAGVDCPQAICVDRAQEKH